MAPKRRVYIRRCAVRNCLSTSANNPEMGFIFVPSNARRRRAWLKIIQSTSKCQKIYCCELHFNLEEDCTNYQDYKQNSKEANINLKLRKEVLPHKSLPATSTNPPILSDTESSEKVVSDESLHETEELIMKLPLSDSCYKVTPTDGQSVQYNYNLKPDLPVVDVVWMSDSVFSEVVDPLKSTISVAHLDSKTNDDKPSEHSLPSFSVKTIKSSKSTISYNPSASGSSSAAGTSVASVANQIKRTQLEFTMESIKCYPKRYLGIHKDSLHIIEILAEATEMNIRDIFIILRKLRLNESHWQLAIAFELSIASIGRIINENVVLLADGMSEFIVWPEIEDVQMNLPNSFKHRFGAVNTIIDCFEIQIQKPTNAVHQALTYSMYKKCNTIKYLIACLPDGLINFISKGAGGRISDQELVRNSGFLNNLFENTMVMADRGFKAIELDLRDKKCCLVRPPSTTANKKMDKEEVLLNKRIASLRIHVERAIGRLREFELLKPHATIESKIINKLDYYVSIACGICNIQPNLINE